MDTQVYAERELHELKRTISVLALGGLIVGSLFLVVSGILVWESTILSADKKSLFLSILGVVGLALVILVLVGRNNSVALVIFNTLLVGVSGITLGLAIGLV